MSPRARMAAAIVAATLVNLAFGTIYAFSVFLKPMEAMLFATPEGNLVVDDPHQQKLDLKTVPADSRQPITLKA